MTKKLFMLVTLIVAFSVSSFALLPSQVESSIHSVNVDEHGQAIKGYDPVAYFTQGKAVLGNEYYTSEYNGAVYQFTSSEHKILFDSDPQHYVPQFGGYCAFGVSKEKKYDIDPDAWAIIDNKLYLNYNQRAHAHWSKTKWELIDIANENWQLIADIPSDKL